MLSVAVVTPSFNQGRFIERTIRSVLAQDAPALEYVVCDGGSTDETQTVLQRYADQLVAVVEPDRGQAHAVNKGIARTSGEVIGWLNSDDVYAPRALATATRYFEAHPEVDVVYGDADLVDADDRVLGRYYTEDWNPRRLRRRPFLCQPAVLFRRGVVDRFGPLDETLHYTLDYEYWLRLASGGARFARVPATLAASRLHPATKTIRDRLAIHAEVNQMLRRYCRRVPDGWLLAQTHAVLEADGAPSPRTPLAFAVAVARVSWQLSHQVNGSVSPTLAASTARTLSAGLVKTMLGRPVRRPAA